MTTRKHSTIDQTIQGRTFDQVISGEPIDLAHTMLVFSLCSRGNLTNKKVMAATIRSWRALKFKPTTMVMIHVGGYDDDPREVWEIEEVRRFVKKFCAETDAHKHPRLEPQSRDILLACGADPDIEVQVTMCSHEQAMQRFADWIKSHHVKPKTS